MATLLSPADLVDFATLTLDRFTKRSWVDISLADQHFIAASKLYTSKKVKERGGKTVKWQVQVRNQGLARNTTMMSPDQIGIVDHMTTGSVPFRKQTTNFSFGHEEEEFQSDAETIIETLKVREHACMNDMWELMEENLWSAPQTTTENRPMGIPFWIKKDATTTPGGAFNGGNPTGFSDGAAGISSTTYPRYKNWTFGYTNVDRDDLVAKVRKAMRFCEFKNPHAFAQLDSAKSNWGFYTTETVLAGLELLLEGRNDNLGVDLAKYMGSVLINGSPVEWVPYLNDNDTSDPFYGVNWAAFIPFVQKGYDMRRSEPIPVPHQHNWWTVHFDHYCNYMCINRRRCFVGSKS